MFPRAYFAGAFFAGVYFAASGAPPSTVAELPSSIQPQTVQQQIQSIGKTRASAALQPPPIRTEMYSEEAGGQQPALARAWATWFNAVRENVIGALDVAALALSNQDNQQDVGALIDERIAELQATAIIPPVDIEQSALLASMEHPRRAAEESLPDLQPQLPRNSDEDLLALILSMDSQRGDSHKHYVGTHAERANYPAAAQTIGSTYYETDRTTWYTVKAAAGVKSWTRAAGVYRSVFANRPADLGANDAGFQFFTSDRNIWSAWDGSGWVYLAGVQIAYLANIPTPTASEVGYRFHVFDYDHVLRWTGTGWTWAPEDQTRPGTIWLGASDPGTGWQLCNGSTVNVLNANGTTASVTVPNLTTAEFLKLGTATNFTPAAAAGNTDYTTPTNQATSLSVSVSVSVDPHATGAVQSGAGATVVTDSGHTASGSGSVTPNPHNHIQDQHRHGPGDLSPRSITIAAYYRR